MRQDSGLWTPNLLLELQSIQWDDAFVMHCRRQSAITAQPAQPAIALATAAAIMRATRRLAAPSRQATTPPSRPQQSSGMRSQVRRRCGRPPPFGRFSEHDGLSRLGKGQPCIHRLSISLLAFSLVSWHTCRPDEVALRGIHLTLSRMRNCTAPLAPDTI